MKKDDDPTLPKLPTAFDELDAPLPREEFLALLAVPLSEEEKAELLDLVRWFTTRYPTPASRLRYARKEQARRPRRPPRSSGPDD